MKVCFAIFKYTIVYCRIINVIFLLLNLNLVKTSCEDHILKKILTCTCFFFSFFSFSLAICLNLVFPAFCNLRSFLIISNCNKEDDYVKSVLEFTCRSSTKDVLQG